jgi:hypothetical protein
METYYFTIKNSDQIFQIKAKSVSDFKRNYKRVADGVLSDYSTELSDVKDMLSQPKLSKKVKLLIDNLYIKESFDKKLLEKAFNEKEMYNLYNSDESLPYVFYDGNIDLWGFCSKQSFIDYCMKESVIDYVRNGSATADVELYKFPSGDKVEFEIVTTIKFK